jgi:phosphohistidine phosphatase SixA
MRDMRKLSSGLAIAAAAMLLLSSMVAAKATEAGWALLREGGQIVLIRHAFSSGSGDARGFSIDDCSTQRNLSERGRQQAEKMGALFAARAGRIERVVSSRYCRCVETATVAFEDNKVEVLDGLDLLPQDATAAKTANDAVMKLIIDYGGVGSLILVTHLENIAALTGVSPREGEAVIVRLEGPSLRVLGRVVF